MGVEFEDTMPAAARLQKLLTAMANLGRPCLLVIDNANEVDDLEANYQHLRRCTNFHLLLTSRITDFGQAAHYRIKGLPEPEALELFQKYYPKFQPETEETLFKQIRQAVGGNTLVIELLAKNLALFNRLKSHYTLPNLLEDLQTKGLLQLSLSQPVRTDYQSTGTMRRETPEAIIAAMYDLGELPAEEVAQLSVFAVLPAESIGFNMLETLLTGTIDLENLLLSLTQKGWIEYNDDHISFKCSPVVQEIVRRKNPNLRLDCKVLVDTLNEKLKYHFGAGHLLNASYVEALHFARFAETVVVGFETPDSNLSMLCERLGSYFSSTGNLGKALFLFEKELQIFKALCVTKP